MAVNSFVITGNLTRDVEVRSLPSGTSVVNGSLAHNYNVKRGDEWVQEVSYFEFVIFGKRGEALAKYAGSRGDRLTIQGTLRQDRWEDRETGAKRDRVKLMVDEFDLPPKESSGGGSRRRSEPGDDFQGATAGERRGGFTDPDDDIPF